MPTHAESAAALLRGAASFFRSLAEDMTDVDNRLAKNASVYETVARLLESDPLGRSAIGYGANDN